MVGMAKKHNKGPITHGCYQDLSRVDGRTREGKFLARYQAQLLSDLGVGDDSSIPALHLGPGVFGPP